MLMALSLDLSVSGKSGLEALFSQWLTLYMRMSLSMIDYQDNKYSKIVMCIPYIYMAIHTT